MAVTTLKGHVSRAIDFYNKTEVFFSLGKTTAWDDELNPPTPKNTDDMVEILGHKKVESVFLVIPVTDGSAHDLEFRDSKWKIVPINEAYAKGARWVYAMSIIEPTDFDTHAVYRQIGITTGLKRHASTPTSKSNLLPSEVEDAGNLEIIDNRTPIYREFDQKERLSIVIEF